MTKPDAREEIGPDDLEEAEAIVKQFVDRSSHLIDILGEDCVRNSIACNALKRGMALERARVCRELREWSDRDGYEAYLYTDEFKAKLNEIEAA